ncbi:MAG: hypothetical protein AB1649_22300, partial [Chloroflexota bacterium]
GPNNTPPPPLLYQDPSMKLDKLKRDPIYLILYGVLGLFTIITVITLVTRSLPNQPDETARILTATQALVLTEQIGTQSAGNPYVTSMSSTPLENSSLVHTTPSLDQDDSQISGTETTTSMQTPPSGEEPPPGVNATQVSGSVSPPSALTPPPGLQTNMPQGSPPPNGSPPPTLQRTPTQGAHPPGGTPPPTLHITATEPLPPAGGTPPPTPSAVGSGTYNNTHIAWQYSTGWSFYSGDGPYDQDFHYTGTVGNYVDLIFTGRGLIFIYTASPNRGLIDVYIDGSKIDTIDAYSATTEWQSTWISTTLTNGTHTVRFVHAGGGTDKNIDVDAITILP